MKEDMSNRMRDVLRALDGYTRGDHRPWMSATSIALACGLTHPEVTPALRALQRRGFVARRPTLGLYAVTRDGTLEASEGRG